MPKEFVHLHVHTDYSLLDGACTIYNKKNPNQPDIVKLAKQYNMPSVAITDHGFMGGAIDFYQSLTGNGIKPIIGCEMYISPTNMRDKNPKTPNIKGYHLVLLAKDFEGYKNLCELNSKAHLKGMYYKPRIDKDLLTQKSKGLIALSGCLQGEIQQYLLKDKVKDAEKALSEYTDIMGKEDFYLEVMDHGLEDQKKVNKGLIELSKKFNIPKVATNDAHYLVKDHAKSHELMLCIQTNSTINDENHFKFPADEFYFKSGDEMYEVFKDIPEAVSNTLEVSEKCNVEIPFAPDVNHYPVYEIKEDIPKKEYLRNICLENMKDRYNFDPRNVNSLDEYQEKIFSRMDYELDIIDKSKYCSYFLVVWDFLRYAREHKVPIGPGRGSGAGSIVAYLTYITDIDPLKYNLLFERFLNPDRVNPPDFDIDFCERRRSEVIDYVREKYGEDSVAQIGTYGTLKAKAVIKDVGRALGHSFEQRDKITKQMSNDPGMTLSNSKEENPEIKTLLENQDWIRDIFEYSEPLEGLNRNLSIHAAGVIIGDQPLERLVPLSRGAGQEVVTQYPAGPCEDMGLLKMDFLGLSTLTIIQDTIDIVENTRGKSINISKIPLDDKNTYDLLNRGDTVGVFQLESAGMRELCKKFGVYKIEDIIALIALYRPGPMQFIGDFIERKNGRANFEYEHPKMEPILKETYGIMLYQEQIMQVVQALAGFSLGEADILRRAISKKKSDVLAKQKEKFIRGCHEYSNISEEKANNIWDKIQMFAHYGFNKSHSASYAFLSYRTAYLKANYPVEFMTSVLTKELNNADKLSFFIKECKEMGINVLPPHINTSNYTFTTDKGAIRFGLAAIKGVGESASKIVIDTREKDGSFVSFMDFAERAGVSLGSKVLENLIKAGAVDGFKIKRSQLLSIMNKVMALAERKVRDKNIGQGNLFDFMGDESKNSEEEMDFDIPDMPEIPEQEKLKYEKELLGFYVSGHPLEKYRKIIEKYSTHPLGKISALQNDIGIKVGGIITSVDVKTTKKQGNKLAIITLEGLENKIECIAFSDVYEQIKDMLEVNNLVYIVGFTLSKENEEYSKIKVNNLYPLDTVTDNFTDEIRIYLDEKTGDENTLENLKSICTEFPGKTPLVLVVRSAEGEVAFIETDKEFNVNASNSFIRKLGSIIEENNIRLKPDLSLPEITRYNGKKKNNLKKTTA